MSYGLSLPLSRRPFASCIVRLRKNNSAYTKGCKVRGHITPDLHPIKYTGDSSKGLICSFVENS